MRGLTHKNNGNGAGNGNGALFAKAPGSNGSSPNVGQLFTTTLARYRNIVTAEIRDLIVEKSFRRTLASRMAEYPLRLGKGLRPSLCLATCQAYGGKLEHALNSAVALELFHNAFLVHDDIEDESIHRRGEPTIYRKYGPAIAINVGDALSVLSLTPLLKNLEVVGLEKSLRIFREIEMMTKESVDGQAMELEWVKKKYWNLSERSYYVMTNKKTCWYTCVTPFRIGAIVGGNGDVDLDFFNRLGFYMGVAFQIQDDVLNLVGEEKAYGKERAGDIHEGKKTIMLINLLQRSTTRERTRIIRILSKPRTEKTHAEVEYILELMKRYRCIDRGRLLSKSFATKARKLLEREASKWPDTSHKRFLKDAIDYVIYREL